MFSISHMNIYEACSELMAQQLQHFAPLFSTLCSPLAPHTPSLYISRAKLSDSNPSHSKFKAQNGRHHSHSLARTSGSRCLLQNLEMEAELPNCLADRLSCLLLSVRSFNVAQVPSLLCK